MAVSRILSVSSFVKAFTTFSKYSCNSFERTCFTWAFVSTPSAPEDAARLDEGPPPRVVVELVWSEDLRSAGVGFCTMAGWTPSIASQCPITRLSPTVMKD